MFRKKNKLPAETYSVDFELEYGTATIEVHKDSIEKNERFRIQIAGERISVPPDAIFNIEHEREGDNEEIEFQMKWVVPEK